MIEINLRQADAGDIEHLFTWVNDPITRQASFNSTPIGYEQHQKWFESSLKNPNRRIFVAVNQQGNSIGAVRIDKLNPDVAEFDINIAPIMRGKGYGAAIISAVCERNDFGVKLFLARIKNDNLASIKTFRKAGFIDLFAINDSMKGEVLVMVKKS